MVKTKTTAMIMASAMMLALMGCGESASADSTEGISITSENIPEENMTESSSATDTNPSEEKKTSDSNAPEDSIVDFDGKKVSVLDDLDSIMSTLGEPSSKSNDAISTFYSFGDGKIECCAATIDGKEAPITLSVKTDEIKTSKGIGIGNTIDDVAASYGEPTEDNIDEDAKAKGLFLHMGYYDFGDYTLAFKYDEDGKVTSYWYINDENDSKM